MVIFIVGGTTYEESRTVALQNASNSGVRFILGGSVVLNSKRYDFCHHRDLLIDIHVLNVEQESNITLLPMFYA